MWSLCFVLHWLIVNHCSYSHNCNIQYFFTLCIHYLLIHIWLFTVPYLSASLPVQHDHCPPSVSLSLSGHVISDTATQTMTRILPRLRSLKWALKSRQCCKLFVTLVQGQHGKRSSSVSCINCVWLVVCSLSDCSWSPAAGLQLLRALRQCVRLEALWWDTRTYQGSWRKCLRLLSIMFSLCFTEVWTRCPWMRPAGRVWHKHWRRSPLCAVSSKKNWIYTKL